MGSRGEVNMAAVTSPHTINLQIGSVCCAIRYRDDEVDSMLRRLYHDFITENPADITIELKETSRMNPDDLETVVARSEYIQEKNRFRTTEKIISGRYDLLRRTIRIAGDKNLLNPDLEVNHLNQLLTMAYYAACVMKYKNNPPEMLVHACGIVHDGYVIIFSGPSESGKSTIARLCSERHIEVINDEMLLVSRPGLNGSVSVRNAPIIGEFQPRRSIAAPLRCVFLLKKGDSTRLHSIDKADAYLHFIRQVISPSCIGQKDKRSVYSLMADFSADITNNVPVYELEFNLDGESLWRIIESVNGAHGGKG